MARLTEEMVIARSKQSDLSAIKKLNCWGAELGDVSLLRRMPNVEVLALSINKIRTLGDFANCRRLRELYVRKNEIRSLAEIRYLRRLPDLTSLWLEENPCTDHPEYRMTVLRNLPNLEKLDNVSVGADEVQEAMRRGHHIPDSDDEGYPQQQESFGQWRRQRSSDSSPEREPQPYTQRRHEGSDSSEPEEVGGEVVSAAPPPDPQSPVSPRRCPAAPAPASVAASSSPEDERCRHPASIMTTSQYTPRSRPRSPDNSLRHSFSAQSVKEYAYSHSSIPREVTSPPNHYHDPYYEKPERSESYQQVSGRCGEWEQERSNGRERDREYPSAVMAEHRGFTRRPVARNSNLLSAVLCLVKELDYPALEVAEMAVRCRMDELANSQ